MGLKVLAIDGDPTAEGFTLANSSIVADIRDKKSVISAIEGAGVVPTGVISFASEAGMAAAAEIREHYNLRGPGRVLTEALTNKLQQRMLWSSSDIPGPKWAAARTAEEAQLAAETIGYPVIVKPIDCAGSRGVSKVNELAELLPAVEAAFSGTRAESILVEEWMNGTEYTVETFGISGKHYVLAVTEKRKVPETGGTVAMELATPESADLARRVGETAVAALLALDYFEGPGHTEIIVDNAGRAGLVESAGRGGGFMVFEKMVQLASGYDIVSATVMQSMGNTPPTPVPANRGVVLRFFPSVPGVVKSINGLDSAAMLPGVLAGSFVCVGDRVGKVSGDGDRLGYLLVASENVSKAKAMANQADALISFNVE
jgi:biotin carboxylase